MLDKYDRDYGRAASRADSGRAADSALAAALTLLRRDPLNSRALLISAKFYLVRGDTARMMRALRAIRRTDSAAGQDVVSSFFAEAGRARDWVGMAASGRTLPQACERLPRASSRGSVPPPAVGQHLPCAQLLTAYLASNQLDRADTLLKRIRVRFHLLHDGALRLWYATQLRLWGDELDGGGTALANAVLQRNPKAAAVGRGLLPDAVGRLTQWPADCGDPACFNKAAAKYASEHPLPTEVWPSGPPADMPFPRSRSLTGIAFSDTFAYYTRADTWYPSWGADDMLYAQYADGYVADSGGNEFLVGENSATSGRAVIRGDDPLHLTVTALPLVNGAGAPYAGRYPSANLVYRGVWYAGTYTLDEQNGSPCGNWCVLGPFVGFHWSTDQGRTWHEPPPDVTPARPLFGESALDSARVKLSAAHFVDFGKDMRYSPDGKAYLIGHGATEPHANSSWMSGDQIYLARVTPTPETINDVKAWEFYAGRDARGRPHWSSRFADIKPLLEWKDHLGSAAVTYDAPLKKYLMFVTHGWPTVDRFDTMVLEADQVTGPWRLVSYLKNFGPQAYFINMVSKFTSSDGHTAWLASSANFGEYVGTGLLEEYGIDPPGGGYWLTLQKVHFLGPTARARRRPRR